MAALPAASASAAASMRASAPLPAACPQHSNEEHAELEARLLAAVAAARQGDWAALQREMEAANKASAGRCGFLLAAWCWQWSCR